MKYTKIIQLHLYAILHDFIFKCNFNTYICILAVMINDRGSEVIGHAITDISQMTYLWTTQNKGPEKIISLHRAIYMRALLLVRKALFSLS